MNNLRNTLNIILAGEPFTQDVKEIFLNEGVFTALQLALDIREEDHIVDRQRVEVARALWVVAGSLGKLGEDTNSLSECKRG